MRVENIGELTDRGMYWRLLYRQCQHVQFFARLGLEDVERAVREARHYYAQRLNCPVEMVAGRRT